jgi:hypothetical protein
MIMSDTSTTDKINWLKILQIVMQAAISALTALGVSSCTIL